MLYVLLKIANSVSRTLSFRPLLFVNARLVIERGWGERQALSGVCRLIPLSKEYLLIYAPRDEEELSVIERIMAASIGFMTNSHDVQF